MYFTPPESVGVPTTCGPLANSTLCAARSANVHVIWPLSGIWIFAGTNWLWISVTFAGPSKTVGWPGSVASGWTWPSSPTVLNGIFS